MKLTDLKILKLNLLKNYLGFSPDIIRFLSVNIFFNHLVKLFLYKGF